MEWHLRKKEKLYDKNKIVYQARIEQRKRQTKGRKEEKKMRKGNQINFQNRSRT